MIDEITKHGRENGVEEAALSDAWNDAYTSMDVIGAYHLEEDGFYIGEATKEAILNDAAKREINFRNIDDLGKLLRVLDLEFVVIYKQNVEDAIKVVA